MKQINLSPIALALAGVTVDQIQAHQCWTLMNQINAMPGPDVASSAHAYFIARDEDALERLYTNKRTAYIDGLNADFAQCRKIVDGCPDVPAVGNIMAGFSIGIKSDIQARQATPSMKVDERRSVHASLANEPVKGAVDDWLMAQPRGAKEIVEGATGRALLNASGDQLGIVLVVDAASKRVMLEDGMVWELGSPNKGFAKHNRVMLADLGFEVPATNGKGGRKSHK